MQNPATKTSKTMRKGISTTEFTVKINILRVEKTLNKEFSQKELSELLRAQNLPCSTAYFNEYVKHKIILRKGKNSYGLPDEPIYKGKIDAALLSIRKYKIDNNKKLSDKAIQESNAKHINECISFLKDNGYLVFKQL